MKIDVCPGDDLQTFYPPLKQTDRGDVFDDTAGELELDSLNLVCLAKSLIFFLDLRTKYVFHAGNFQLFL